MVDFKVVGILKCFAMIVGELTFLRAHGVLSGKNQNNGIVFVVASARAPQSSVLLDQLLSYFLSFRVSTWRKQYKLGPHKKGAGFGLTSGG